MATIDPTATYESVKTHYSALARELDSLNAPHSNKIALSFGYDAEDLVAIPAGANLGLSCGNPIALARLKNGETVVDLGSGAGFDVFQAARRVGSTGKAIGIDMSEEMLTRANLNALKASITNTQFVLSPITAIPLSSQIADCIISNCVINLVPASDKHLVFKEIFRLLKPGGRVAVSDILAKKELDPEMQRDLQLYVGCVSGAAKVGEYENWLKEAGFEDILIVDKQNNLNLYKERSTDLGAIADDFCCATQQSCCSTAGSDDEAKKQADKKIALLDFNEWVGSYNIYAIKAIH